MACNGCNEFGRIELRINGVGMPLTGDVSIDLSGGDRSGKATLNGGFYSSIEPKPKMIKVSGALFVTCDEDTSAIVKSILDGSLSCIEYLDGRFVFGDDQSAFFMNDAVVVGAVELNAKEGTFDVEFNSSVAGWL